MSSPPSPESSVGESQVYPYRNPYSAPSDVGAKFGNTSLFTTTTVPTTAMVQDIIVRKDSWIDNLSGHDWRLHSTAETYDAVGTGPRGGSMFLRNYPIISVDAVEYWDSSLRTWVKGIQGLPGDDITAPGGPAGQPQIYYVYPEQALVVWRVARFTDRQKYQVRYTYGYPSVPDYIRDLSANLAAQEVLMVFSGKFMPPEPERDYLVRFKDEEMRLTSQLTVHRPMVATA